MQPDVLCLNLIGFLSLFGLEESFLLCFMYYLIMGILICSAVALAAYACVVLYGFYFKIPMAKVKRGKFGE